MSTWRLLQVLARHCGTGWEGGTVSDGHSDSGTIDAVLQSLPAGTLHPR